MYSKLFHATFWAAALTYTFFGEILPYPASIAIKAFPILLLLLWAFYSLTGKLRLGTSIALIASMAGDVFLAMKSDLFIPGLASFLMAQLTYAAIFWSRKNTDHHRKWLVLVFIPSVFIVGAVVLPATGDLLLPVTAYFVAISAMVVGAALSDRPWQWLYLGAFSFAISDSLIALNKFVLPIHDAELWIMLFYYLAQYLMINGLIRGEKQQ